MAPRKKATKQRKKDNPRMAKLEALMCDFDSEVSTRVSQMKGKLEHLMKSANSSYTMAIIKLPKSVRTMNWMEYLRSEKPKSPEVDNSKREVEHVENVECVLTVDHTKSVKKASKKTATSSEDENTQNENPVKKGRPAKKPPTTSKKAKALSVSKKTTSIRRTSRSNRKPMVTPATSRVDSCLMGPTPLVTPRFDPRLPKTPGLRGPHHKERIYSMSVNGSPINTMTMTMTMLNEDILIQVPVGNGEFVQMLASEMDSADLSALDENALRSIQQLQKRLTTLCGSK